jgi:hypothetical protein
MFIKKNNNYEFQDLSDQGREKGGEKWKIRRIYREKNDLTKGKT